MKAGFYFQLGKKEVFVETTYKKKTEKLASNIFMALIKHGYSIPDNPDTRKELLYYLLPASLEIKHCPDTEFGPAHDYYNIFGKSFSGYGSDNINDGKTIIITI